jgi:hypothetical protein
LHFARQDQEASRTRFADWRRDDNPMLVGARDLGDICCSVGEVKGVDLPITISK